MTDELKTVEKGTQSAFEKNLMSDLIDEYKTNDKIKIPFDLKKIRRMHANKGYGITAWDDKMLQERVDDLGNKRLIDDLGNGEYQISDKGINWEENKKPPL
jgi:hypothetical protein